MHSLRVTKIKGHATYEDISEGKNTLRDKECNDKSGELADRGNDGHGGKAFMKVALWIHDRNKDYQEFMGKIYM